MKEKFSDHSFSEIEGQLIAISNQIIDRYARQGYDLSLRQLFYQLVTINAISNTVRSYEFLGRLMTEARMAGLVDWSMIVDRGRVTLKTRQYSSPGKAIRALSKSFKLNRWENQPAYIEVMVEKQALEGVLSPVCGKWGIHFTSNKGYSSASALYAAAKRLGRKLDKGKEVVVLYLGDHDPSGVDMTRDLRDRLSTFARASIDVKRLALNMSQVEANNLPPNPAKLSDSRATTYVAKYGTSSWELDALAPNVLADIVSAAVLRRLDLKAWNEDGEREKLAIKLIRDTANIVNARFSGVKSQKLMDQDVEPIDPFNMQSSSEDGIHDSSERSDDVPYTED